VSQEQVTQRWSAQRKRDVVLRLLRGEPIDTVSREINVPVHQLETWRQSFLELGLEGLRARPRSADEVRLAEAQKMIGELTMENELLKRRIELSSRPLAPRRSPR